MWMAIPITKMVLNSIWHPQFHISNTYFFICQILIARKYNKFYYTSSNQKVSKTFKTHNNNKKKFCTFICICIVISHLGNISMYGSQWHHLGAAI